MKSLTKVVPSYEVAWLHITAPIWACLYVYRNWFHGYLFKNKAHIYTDGDCRYIFTAHVYMDVLYAYSLCPSLYIYWEEKAG
jgi:hypothetical protein